MTEIVGDVLKSLVLEQEHLKQNKSVRSIWLNMCFEMLTMLITTDTCTLPDTMLVVLFFCL